MISSDSGRSTSQTCASVVVTSISCTVSAKRSISRGADCSPTMSTRPPRRVAAIALRSAFGAPDASITTWAPVAARRREDQLSEVALLRIEDQVGSEEARRLEPPLVDVHGDQRRDPLAAAMATMNAPIPPTPITTQA